jgi:putative peptide zinc metalloprotease protein
VSTTVDGSTTPGLAPGVELLGPYQGSGFREARYLVRRGDGQVAQLPALLYRTACLADGTRDLAAIAAVLADEFPETFPGGPDDEQGRDRVAFLLERKLTPAGITAPTPDALPADGSTASTGPAGPARRDHLLMLRMRRALVPPRVGWGIAGIFRWFFAPVAVVAALAAFVAVDVALAARTGWSEIVTGGQHLVANPGWTLAVIGVVVLVGMFHECGHVAACRHGGAVPGAMGVGVYIVWPAFYSTVTDAYRLSRAGRLRTDLGGVFFNAIGMTVLGAAYLATGAPWLLAAIALLHLETAWQFLPSLRLDGYYVLADLVGVPDLFARMRPILAGLLHPRRTPPPAVRELKPWVRRTVTAWAVLVVPFLCYWVVLFVVLAPELAPAAWEALRVHAATLVNAVGAVDPMVALLAAVQIVLLVLPWASGTVLALNLARRLGRAPLRALRRRVARARP